MIAFQLRPERVDQRLFADFFAAESNQHFEQLERLRRSLARKVDRLVVLQNREPAQRTDAERPRPALERFGLRRRRQAALANDGRDVLLLDAVRERLGVEPRHDLRRPPGVVLELLCVAHGERAPQAFQAARLVASVHRDLGLREECQVFDGLRFHRPAFGSRLADEPEAAIDVPQQGQDAAEPVAEDRQGEVCACRLCHRDGGPGELARARQVALHQPVPGGQMLVDPSFRRACRGQAALHAPEVLRSKLGVVR